MRCLFIAGIVILLGVPTRAFGADTPDPGSRPWTVSAALCAGSGFSTHGVEKLMRKAGYDDPELPWSGDPISTPHSDHFGRGAMIVVRRRLGPTTHLRLMFDRTTLGESVGYRQGIADSVVGGYLVLNQAVMAASIVADVGQRGDRGFYGGIGPSVVHVTMKDPQWHEAPSVSATRLGATVVLGYVFAPPGRRMYVGLEAQGRCIGPVRFGPMDHQYAGTLPEADVSFIHGVVCLEVGVRL